MQFAYQGMAGTILAEINAFVLLFMFPQGGKCTQKSDRQIWSVRKSCLKYEDQAYGEWGWAFFVIDNVVVTTLMFVLNTSLPVKKWFLCWNSVFSMQFASFDGMERTHSVMVTTVMGCVLAVTSMLPRLRRRALSTAPENIVKQLFRALQDLFDFLEFQRDRGVQHSSVSESAALGAIESELRGVQEMATRMTLDLDVVWWETLGLYRRKDLKLWRGFVEALVLRGDSGGLLTVLHLALDAAQEAFRSDYSLDARDAGFLQDLRILVKQTEELTRFVFKDVLRTSTDSLNFAYLSSDIRQTKCRVECFRPSGGDAGAISMYACSLTFLAEAVLKCASAPESVESVSETWRQMAAEMCSVFLGAGKATLRVTENVSYTFRNTSVILIAFWAGYWLQSSFLPGFETNMVVSLALMLSEPMPGLSLNMNVKRLLGVSVGKSLTDCGFILWRRQCLEFYCTHRGCVRLHDLLCLRIL